MKNITKLFFLTLGLIVVSCDEGFDELNVNKNAATAINPVFILNNAVINASYVNTTIIYEIGIVQQMVTPNSGVLTGANFNQDNRDATNQNWVRYYRSVVRHSTDVIIQAQALPTRTNLLNMAKIFRSFAFMVLTDTYGDIPYFDAGKGYSDQITLPKYDAQQAIYADIIKTLTDASAALDATKTIETADILYGGDIAKWKKFGNSLLLRAGMRLTKVDPTLAQSTVQKAVAGGLMTSNADNAFSRHDANYVNSIGNWMNSTEAANSYMAAPFLDHLKRTSDPRLKAIAVRYVGAKSGPEQTAARASTDTSLQIGMPFGYDNNGITAQATARGLASFYDFSQVDRTRFGKNTAPMFFVTYSQTSLLLAEAIQRGWASGSAADAFKNGIKAHMDQCAMHDANSAIPAASADAYIAANPYNAATGLEQINTQYWISSFMNGPEAFANFRRSGFPKLTPNPFPGKGIKGDFIRRLTYPNSEISVNSTNVKEAISRQGADDLDTRVWWDKQ
ncbi:MAG: SusD/RagB family nutrient-binding outer membrane lipoprotein [Saprospiraceae bacterium]|nr:SusD/RagB family nutrient-binding outer membrane lipoprotein [Saprospiraceae bacterium]